MRAAPLSLISSEQRSTGHLLDPLLPRSSVRACVPSERGSANASSRVGGASSGNGILQIEQRTAPMYSIKQGAVDWYLFGMQQFYAARLTFNGSKSKE